jgi:hypothetical protein
VNGPFTKMQAATRRTKKELADENKKRTFPTGGWDALSIALRQAAM